MPLMILFLIAVDQNIIKIGNVYYIKQTFQSLIDIGLKCSRDID